jgi:hypothetical protein
MELWTCFKQPYITLMNMFQTGCNRSKITNPYATMSMLLRTLEDFNYPQSFESLNVFFKFNRHKHHIMHVMQDFLLNFNIIELFHCTQSPCIYDMPCAKEDGDILWHNPNNLKYVYANYTNYCIYYRGKYIVTFVGMKILGNNLIKCIVQ